MAIRQSLTAGAAVSAAALMLAIGVVFVVTSQVVQGPWVLLKGAQGLVAAQAFLLALATAAATLIPRPAAIVWHADGTACLAILICLAGALGAGWEELPPLLRSAGGVLAPLSVAPLFALVEQRFHRTLRWTWWAAAVLGALSIALFVVRNPFDDPRCWADCSLQGVAPFPSRQAAGTLAIILGVAGWVVAVAACLLAMSLVLSILSALRRTAAGTWLDSGIAASAAVAALSVAVLLAPSRGTAARAAFVCSSAECALALLMILQSIQTLHRRRRLRRLVLALGDVPPLGALEAMLGRLLGDRELRVAYWLPESRRYVYASGEPAGDDAASALTLRRADEPLAQVRLSKPEADVRDLHELIGSAALLAIDSERLQAELRAQLNELQASRQRIVAAADETRRRVEHSLHDIVQAELLAALYDMALAKSEAQRLGATATAERAARSADWARELVVSLRNFSHGVYPAALDAAGLPAALDALADEAPTALSLGCRLSRRPPADVERATYVLIHDAVMRAELDVSVDVDLGDKDLVVQISGYPGDVPVHIEDRLGAFGGALSVGGGSLRAVLPCG